MRDQLLKIDLDFVLGESFLKRLDVVVAVNYVE